MKLIKPSLISGEIMTLIEEADEKLIIVSPYYDFDKWKKFLNTIDYLKNKEIDVEFYVREGENKSAKQVLNIGFIPTEIKNLHVKLYINEKTAIVSSMNLLMYSDINSLDIAYKTETKKEYKELYEYYKRYIQFENTQNSFNDEYSKIQIGEWTEYIGTKLWNKLERNFRFEITDNTLNIYGPNLYFAHISNSKKSNFLNISGILSGSEKDALLILENEFKEKSGLENTIYEPKPNENSYNTIWHHSKVKLKSSSINFLKKDDFRIVIPIIVEFITALENFKNSNYYERMKIER